MNTLAKEFSELMARLSADVSREPVREWAARVSEQTQGGHSCVDASEAAELLRGSTVVGGPGEGTPLVLDAAGRLYLARMFEAEQFVSAEILRRAKLAGPSADAAMLERWLPGPMARDQRHAVAATMARHFSIITGGPGTGKTRTVAVLLAALARENPSRVMLAAPTGKAAARLAQSIAATLPQLGLDEAALAAIPREAATIHRLLGAGRWLAEFRHHRGNPLPCDTLIVDESSMIGLSLMARLLEALPAHARLVLVGDRSQLSSVEPGAVLGDLCVDGAPWVAELRHTFRFEESSAIGGLAAAILSGDAERAAELAFADEAGEARESVSAWLEREVYPRYTPMLEASEPGAALAALDAFRVLCATRVGRQGSEALNGQMELYARRVVHAVADGRWFHGQPVMVLENDAEIGLFNGDTGIVLRGEGGLRVWFRGADGEPRGLAPARLPRHETAFAMTVHKSQGSEFQEVALVLPHIAAEGVTRELLYTAVTRARRRVLVRGSRAVLQAGVATVTTRASGLRDAMRGGL